MNRFEPARPCVPNAVNSVRVFIFLAVTRVSVTFGSRSFHRIHCDFVAVFSRGTALAPTKARYILLCDLSTIEGEAYSQSRNHEYLGRDRLRGWEQTNQRDTWHRA